MNQSEYDELALAAKELKRSKTRRLSATGNF